MGKDKGNEGNASNDVERRLVQKFVRKKKTLELLNGNPRLSVIVLPSLQIWQPVPFFETLCTEEVCHFGVWI